MESAYGYFTSYILDADELIKVKYGATKRKGKIRTLHRSICKVLDDLESTSDPGTCPRVKSIMELDCFSIIASSCCYNPILGSLLGFDTAYL